MEKLSFCHLRRRRRRCGRICDIAQCRELMRLTQYSLTRTYSKYMWHFGWAYPGIYILATFMNLCTHVLVGEEERMCGMRVAVFGRVNAAASVTHLCTMYVRVVSVVEDYHKKPGLRTLAEPSRCWRECCLSGWLLFRVCRCFSSLFLPPNMSHCIGLFVCKGGYVRAEIPSPSPPPTTAKV